LVCEAASGRQAGYNAALKRRFSNFILRISTLLCIVFAVCWIRSLWRNDLVFFQRMQQSSTPSLMESHNEIWLASASGTFSFGWSIWRDSLPHPRGQWTRIVRSQPTAKWNSLYLHATWRGNPFRTLWMSSVSVPYPLAVIVFSLPLIARWLLNRRRKRSDAMNLCRGCGYDLRATPERCPECGLIVVKA
jgi:hypothetical protein